MPQEYLPASLASILLSFAGCFTQPSFGNFTLMVTGWILCPGRHSISRVVQAAGESARTKHHSTLYRFLSRGRWTADALGEKLFDLLVPLTGGEIVAIVDDTLCHKSGPHLFGAGMHHDASRSTYGRRSAVGRRVSFAFGHNWVVVSIWIPVPWKESGGVALPVLFRLYRSRRTCPTSLYGKRTELAAEMIDLVTSWMPATHTLTVTGDREYACRTLVRPLAADVVFVGPVPMNAALHERPPAYGGQGRPRRKGARLPSPRELAESHSVPWSHHTVAIYGKTVTLWSKSIVCLWYTVAGTRPVRVVITRDPTGRFADRAFFSTDPEASVSTILETFAKRWELEVTFRHTKQHLGLEDPQNGWWRAHAGRAAKTKRPGPNAKGRRGEDAVRHTVPLVFIVYSLVNLWYVRRARWDDDVQRVRTEAPWYRHKATPSFADALAALRRELWVERLSTNPALAKAREKVRDLLPTWLLAA